MDPCRVSGSSVRPRLPRTRGDGPAYDTKGKTYATASPHTRGWTRSRLVRRPACGGFPAHAGMDRSSFLPELRRPGLPRTRGDGPLHTSPTTTVIAASPHTRGWTLGRDDGRRAHRGFPAHAGMDPDYTRGTASSRRLPRTRGDGPPAPLSAAQPVSASPHTRGWTAAEPPVPAVAHGFPAHAGMDLAPIETGDPRRRLPRTRGDGPDAWVWNPAVQEASPHTRGWTPRSGVIPGRPGGFPAHAGMDRAPRRGATMKSRLPRTRGDGPDVCEPAAEGLVASPHTRGWTS